MDSKVQRATCKAVRFARRILTLTLTLAPAIAFSQIATLPSRGTEQALRSLKTPKNLEPSDSIVTKDYKVDPANLSSQARSRLQTDQHGQASLPFVVSNTMLIQFDRNAGKAGIEKFIRERDLTVIEAFPSIGAVKVRTDLSKYFMPVVTDKDQNQTLLRGMNAAIMDFTRDPIVRSASPDLVLNKQSELSSVSNLLKPSEINQVPVAGSAAEVDWGIANIEADKVWAMQGAQDGVVIGVLDVGFGRHKDLVFIDLPNLTPIDDHGTHVAGIACARGAGVRGVLPSCFIRARTGDFFFKSAEGGDVTKFVSLFSQILSTLDRFVSEYDDLRVINVSMGYNWKPNFNINPDDPESSLWRVLVEQQGLMLITALERADKSNKVIYSAAGNDSDGLPNPIRAKYASALNWAAITAREKKIATNGVVVEAHTVSNKRARFSNVGGDISCPGVDVLSTVAHDAGGEPSQVMYGKMSGTSMASPYCAAAHALFSLVRPGYSGREIVQCLKSSSHKTDNKTPVLKLTDALKKCPERSS